MTTLKSCSRSSAAPRWATPATPGRKNLAAGIGKTARLLGFSTSLGPGLMPWQHDVNAVATELGPDGRLVYRQVVVEVMRQQGKALDCCTELLTANRGWTTMADIRPGDQVFHPGGYPVTVTHVSDVMHGHDCYRVTTVDGRSVVADADHLWTVTDKRREYSYGRTRIGRHHKTYTLSTREMATAGLSRYPAGSRTSVAAGKRYTTNEYRFALPVQEPVKSPDVELPIDPWLLGAWLGDGNSQGSRIASGDSDREWMTERIRETGAQVTRVTRCRTAWELAFRLNAAMRDGFQSRCMRLGVWNNKHVPALYLAAGTAQREALLQGLLDTDGTIDGGRCGQVEFCSVNQRLADAVLFLARSLGWRAVLRTGRVTLNGRDCGVKYRVKFTPKATDPYRPFRMPRKAARVQGKDGGKGRTTLSIAAIEPVLSRPVRCIKVDAPDGLFLVGRDLIPTHNSVDLLSMMVARGLRRPGTQIAYTAQTRLDARHRLLDVWWPRIARSKLAPLIDVRKGSGSEALLFKNGSMLGLVSGTETSGHGDSLDLGVIDEAWAQEDDHIEQAMRPAMMTRDAQLWIVSAAGTEKSTYFRQKVDDGRERAEAGLTDTGCYFGYGAADDADPGDPETWWGCMPALGVTVSEEVVQADYELMELSEFRRLRAYLCQWPEIAKPGWEVISQQAWEALGNS